MALNTMGKQSKTDADDDAAEIFQEAGHLPDRDQVFTLGDGPVQPLATTAGFDRYSGGKDESELTDIQDADEGDWQVSDPSFEQTGAALVQRTELGERNLEEHMTPAGRHGEEEEGYDVHLTADELEIRAKALNIPGWKAMSAGELAVAVAAAMLPH